MWWIMGACGYTSSFGVLEKYSRSEPETPTSVLYIAARSLVAAQRPSGVIARMTDSLIVGLDHFNLGGLHDYTTTD